MTTKMEMDVLGPARDSRHSAPTQSRLHSLLASFVFQCLVPCLPWNLPLCSRKDSLIEPHLTSINLQSLGFCFHSNPTSASILIICKIFSNCFVSLALISLKSVYSPKTENILAFWNSHAASTAPRTK